MSNPLEGKHVVLGVTGSIASYKSVELASELVQLGVLVDVILTEAATRFVSSLTFKAITHRPVVESLWESDSEIFMDHVALAKEADVVLVAPATADVLAKLSWGFADDPLLATVLATQAPVLVAPAMDANMWDAAATQANVDRLRSRGVAFAGPLQGRLASGLVGAGRMVEPQQLVGHLKMVLGRGGDLAGKKVVVTAGGTREAIDPVRFLSNHSSGKMGYAIAEAARDRGASVFLVSTANLPDPVGVDILRVSSTAEMQKTVVKQCETADVLLMAAAVSDWRAADVAEQKVKKKSGEDKWNLPLVRNSDIVGSIEGKKLIKVGFAAESQRLKQNAWEKLKSKGLHLVVGNDITAEDSGFGSDNNRVVLIGIDGRAEDLGLLTKYQAAYRILDKVVSLLG